MIIVAIGLLGLVLGSFVNAFVWRLHEQAELKGRRAKSKGQNKHSKQALSAALSPEQLSITKGRSMCPSCHHTLAAKDLIPVLSWLSLRGKCRYCQAPIGWQYPLVELLTAGLFVLSYVCWPLSLHGIGLFQLVLWLGFVVAFMSLAVYDLRWMLLPDKIVFPLIGLAAMQTVIVSVTQHSFSALWQPVAGAVLLSGLFWLLFQVSKGNWIGGGDVKLAVVLGLLAASPLRAMLILFFASFIGTLVSLPVMIASKQNLQLKIPFGPYLLAAMVLVQLYGTAIVNWYGQFFGIN